MGSNIKYSIVIPHHNISHLITRCLDSIPSDKTQIIVVDDNSSEDEKKKLRHIEQLYSHVEFIYNNEGKGAGAARNIGLDHAVGKWLIFVDADDFLVPQTLDIWDSVYHKDDDIIYFNVNCLDSNFLSPSQHLVQRENTIRRLSKNKSQLYKWLRFCFTEPWGKLFNRKFIIDNHIKFQESLVANDYLFSILTGLKAQKVSYSNQPYYNYLIRTGSLSNNHLNSPDKILSRLDVYFEIQDIMKKNGIYLRPFDRFINLVINQKALSKDVIENFLISHNLSYAKVRVNSLLSIFSVLNQKIVEHLNLPYCGF